jgi:hypothetical protein
VSKVLIDQGYRPEEIMAAAKCDFDPESGTLAIRGGKSRAAKRTLYLTPEILAILSARLKTEGPWLFPSERYPGNHITKLNNSHDRACREAGVSFVLYDLRHTFGTSAGYRTQNRPFYVSRDHGSCEPANDHAVRPSGPTAAETGYGAVRRSDAPAKDAEGKVSFVRCPNPFCPSGLGHFHREAAVTTENHGDRAVTKMTIEISRLRLKCWRRGSESNRRIRVLQTLALPLGYSAVYRYN